MAALAARVSFPRLASQLTASKSAFQGSCVPSATGRPLPTQVAQLAVVRAAWTRRPKSDKPSPNRKSWKQRSEKYLKPFKLDVHFSGRYVHAKVMHRVTSRVVAGATTNERNLRESLPSTNDMNACKLIGDLLAERSKEADVYAVVFELKKGERYEGRLARVVDTIVEHGIALI